MAKHSIIDPVDRIEGHLRVEMEVENGVVTDAWVSGGLFRGLELIVEGRDPYDAAMLAQRVCGVCPVSHCHTSVYAAEEAYGIQIPEAAVAWYATSSRARSSCIATSCGSIS